MGRQIEPTVSINGTWVPAGDVNRQYQDQNKRRELDRILDMIDRLSANGNLENLAKRIDRPDLPMTWMKLSERGDQLVVLRDSVHGEADKVTCERAIEAVQERRQTIAVQVAEGVEGLRLNSVALRAGLAARRGEQVIDLTAQSLEPNSL